MLATGASATISLKDHGIPEGSCITFYAEIPQGPDREAHQIFVYSESCRNTASYVISGTAADSTLGLSLIHSELSEHRKDSIRNQVSSDT